MKKVFWLLPSLPDQGQLEDLATTIQEPLCSLEVATAPVIWGASDDEFADCLANINVWELIVNAVAGPDGTAYVCGNLPAVALEALNGAVSDRLPDDSELDEAKYLVVLTPITRDVTEDGENAQKKSTHVRWATILDGWLDI